MQIIKAPNPIPASGGLYHATPMVFLAGSIEMGAAEDWQDRIAREMQDLDVTFLNPRRDNWDSSWTQSIDNPQFRQQVEWELDALERCDIIACYIDPTTKSPITLMEIGLHAKMFRQFVSEFHFKPGQLAVIPLKTKGRVGAFEAHA